MRGLARMPPITPPEKEAFLLLNGCDPHPNTANFSPNSCPHSCPCGLRSRENDKLGNYAEEPFCFLRRAKGIPEKMH